MLPLALKVQLAWITHVGGLFGLFTVTVKLHELALPMPSVARQVTVVVPTGNGWPDVTTWLFWFLQPTVTPGQLSDAVTVKLAGALVAIGHEAAGAVVTLAGQVTTGGVLSVISATRHLLPSGHSENHGWPTSSQPRLRSSCSAWTRSHVSVADQARSDGFRMC